MTFLQIIDKGRPDEMRKKFSEAAINLESKFPEEQRNEFHEEWVAFIQATWSLIYAYSEAAWLDNARRRNQ